ncbi:MAG: ABC transporter ATP-binding protein [Hyphomicrobiaceae bacterium]|nr:MAG: ABC transporter ATP-binding protein [Hyphomicrobiaceae bacterium]
MFRWFETRLDPFATKDVAQPPSGLRAFYWHYLKPIWPMAALLLLVDLVAAVTEVVVMTFLAYLIDMLKLARTPADFLADNATLLVAMGGLVLIGRPLFIIAYELLKSQVISPPFQASVRWQAHRYLLRQSLGFFQNDFAGRVANKLMQTANGLRDTLVLISDAVVFVAVQWIAALALFAAADLRLTLPLLAWFAGYAGILAYFIPRVRTRATEASEARSMLLGRIVDSYTNILTVKLFAHAEREDAYARNALEEQLGKHRAYVRLTTSMIGILNVLNGLLITATTALALWLWTANTVTLGAIVLVTALVLRITQMSGWVMNLVTNIFESIGTVQEGAETISKPQTILDAPAAKTLAVTKGEIRFERIGFNYGSVKGTPGADPKRVIDGLDLTIAAGEKVGLIGRSGAGKSTLVNLLLRFYNLEKGRILVDGQDIAEVTQESLRAQIGMVTQDTSLMHRSVLDNILYGRPEAGLEGAIEAARRAHAHDFILDLEDKDGRKGYAARVGERGVKLSGGQRQRVAIARVLLKDAPILILDEATSALDSEAEAAIQEQLANLMAGKTVIAIAHRLSTISAMDRLIVLDEGRILEQGSHRELLRKGGLYASLWARQSGSFETKQAAE